MNAVQAVQQLVFSGCSSPVHSECSSVNAELSVNAGIDATVNAGIDAGLLILNEQQGLLNEQQAACNVWGCCNVW